MIGLSNPAEGEAMVIGPSPKAVPTVVEMIGTSIAQPVGGLCKFKLSSKHQRISGPFPQSEIPWPVMVQDVTILLESDSINRV